jgi:hypothetical protein
MMARSDGADILTIFDESNAYALIFCCSHGDSTFTMKLIAGSENRIFKLGWIERKSAEQVSSILIKYAFYNLSW